MVKGPEIGVNMFVCIRVYLTLTFQFGAQDTYLKIIEEVDSR